MFWAVPATEKIVQNTRRQRSQNKTKHLGQFSPLLLCPNKELLHLTRPASNGRKSCNWICFSQQSRRLFLPPTIFVQRGFGAGLRLFTAASSRHKSRPSAPAPETLRGLLCRVFALHSAWGKRHNSHSLFNTTSVLLLFLYFNLRFVDFLLHHTQPICLQMFFSSLSSIVFFSLYEEKCGENQLI